MVIHRKLSSNEEVGFGEIWYDVGPRAMTDGTTQIINADRECGSLGPHASGICRSNPIGGTGVIYHDGLRIGRRSGRGELSPGLGLASCSGVRVLVRRRSARAPTLSRLNTASHRRR
jgi:hypothetical protein